MINVAIVAVLLVGCVASDEIEPAPAVVLVEDPADPPLGWEALGFTFGDAGLTECSLVWYRDGETDCQITIGIVRVPMLRERTGTNARTFRILRLVEIDSRLDGYALEIAVAHEVGHILLDTPKHTTTGIMSGESVEVSDQDRRLACESIGLGC